MNWKFWQKKTSEPSNASGTKEAKPKELPQAVGRHLVVNLKLDPDWAWTLRAVTREQSKGILEFKIFDPATAGVKVTGFSTVESHPDIVLYEGVYEKGGGLIEFRDLHRHSSQAA